MQGPSYTHVHGVDLHVKGPLCSPSSHGSLLPEPVDLLPKPAASSGPWCVHHLQTRHGPPGT